jgi:hypothetical protein
MDKEAKSLDTEANSVQCKRRDTSYLAMSCVCNLFATRLDTHHHVMRCGYRRTLHPAGYK